MKRWKLQLILSGLLFVFVVIFALIEQQNIATTSLNDGTIVAKHDFLALVCSRIVGGGLVFIWLLPYLSSRFRKSRKI